MESPYLYSIRSPLFPASAAQHVAKGMTREAVEELLPSGVKFDDEGTAMLYPLEDHTLLWVYFQGDAVTDIQLWK